LFFLSLKARGETPPLGIFWEDRPSSNKKVGFPPKTGWIMGKLAR